MPNQPHALTNHLPRKPYVKNNQAPLAGNHQSSETMIALSTRVESTVLWGPGDGDNELHASIICMGGFTVQLLPQGAISFPIYTKPSSKGNPLPPLSVYYLGAASLDTQKTHLKIFILSNPLLCFWLCSVSGNLAPLGISPACRDASLSFGIKLPGRTLNSMGRLAAN